MTLCLRILMLALAALAAPVAATSQTEQAYAKLAPFEAVQWSADSPSVLIEGQWYVAVAVDGVSVDEILAFSKQHEGHKWQKRFGEDLVELLTRMGHPPGERVSLELQDAAGATIKLTDVALTAAKRRAVREADPRRKDLREQLLSAPVTRVERRHSSKPARAYRELAGALAAAPGATTSRAQAAADLDQLEWLVQHRYSYRDLRGIDVEASFDALRGGLPESISSTEFGLRLARLVGRFGDGHTRVRGLQSALPGPYLGVALEEIEGQVYVLTPDRTAFFDPLHPVLNEFDGQPLERMLATASSFGAHGTPGFMRRHALRYLQVPKLLRSALGTAPSPGDNTGNNTLALGLRSLDAKQPSHASVALELGAPPRLQPEPVTIRSWRIPQPQQRSIGYLAIASMVTEPEHLESVQQAMQELSDTDGLILDVRQNGGGSRAMLRFLLPYFLGPGEPAYVVNAGRYRLEAGQDPERAQGYLENRGLYPASWSGWSSDARQAIQLAARSFQPAWTPLASTPPEFSALHWCVVERSDNPTAFAYQQPVCVLTDSGCFSATDIFLGAFAGRPNVTLVGETSGGGSGRSQSHTLVHSGLRVRLSTMISYRPDGRLYDGQGIAPDVFVAREPEDLLVREAPSDAQLARALELLAR